MATGITVRTRPRVQVLRGWDPMNPTKLTQTAPVFAGEVIQSGDVISLSWVSANNRYEWVQGMDSASATPYIAQDESTDYTVIEAGGLTGLSCAGDFEIQTAAFKTGETYNVDTPLYAPLKGDADAGKLLPCDTTGQAIVGRVTRIRGVKQLQDPANLVFLDSSTSAANSKVITFQTSFGGTYVS